MNRDLVAERQYRCLTRESIAIFVVPVKLLLDLVVLNIQEDFMDCSEFNGGCDVSNPRVIDSSE